jgi:hypothetical protein
MVGGVLDVKKVGRALSRVGEFFSGVEKWISGFHYRAAYYTGISSPSKIQKKPEIHIPTPEAGLSGQKSIKRTQKYVVFEMPARQKYY